MPSVTTRFPPPLHERFLQECEKRDIAPSDFIRKAVEAMMDHIDTPQLAEADKAEIAKATDDAMFHGAGFMKDGKHVPRDEVFKRIPTRGIRGFARDGSGEIKLDAPGARLKPEAGPKVKR